MTTPFDRHEAAASHVAYELQQMAQAAYLLTSPPLPAVLSNALLESFLIHARSLIDFLCEPRRWPSDLHRHDFAPGWDPEGGEAVDRLRRAREPLHKHVAHLTWDRVQPAAQEWEWVALSVCVVEVFAAFVVEVVKAGTPGALLLVNALAATRTGLGLDAAP